MSETPNQGQDSQGSWPPAEGAQSDPHASDPHAWSTPSADPASQQASAADAGGQQPTWSASADQPAPDAPSSTSAESWGSSAGAGDWGSAAGGSTFGQSSTDQTWGQGQQSQPSAADPNAWGQQPGASAASASQPSAADPYGYPQQPGQGADPGSYAPQPQQNPGGYGTPAGGYGQQQGYDPQQGQQQGQWGQSQDPGQSWQVQQAGAAPYGGPGGFPGAAMTDDPTKPSMYQPNQPPPTPGAQPVSPSDDKTWATLTHVGMILFWFLGPLIVYLVYKDRSRWIKLHATESLNFGILVSIVYVISFVLMFVVIGYITWAAMGIVALIFGILGAMAANRGEYKPYPFNIRMIK